MPAFSQFIIYADESGSPVLGADAQDFPIFVLNFLLIEKRLYSKVLEPQVAEMKFGLFGHDQVILHEREMRRMSGAFAPFRVRRPEWSAFLSNLNALFSDQTGQFTCSIVDKAKLTMSDSNRWSPYDIALGMCMEMAADRIAAAREKDTEIHVVFEARGKKEDQHLELEFRRIASGDVKVSFGSGNVTRFRWSPVFIDKRSNCAGLQCADLAARPIGLSYLRPSQTNRAYSAMRTGYLSGGVRVFP